MGYLGKISALVTANTGDFSRNLNAAASDVRKFAATVQSNITKASSDAERSFKAIYTPLQTLERSLKAASSMKLSFKGFDGAIRDVNVLKERLTSLKGTQVDLILKASGLQTISEFRNAIKDISNESFNFAIKFGGIDKLKLIREELRGVSSTSIKAVLSAGGLERLRELKNTVDGLKGDQLTLALRVGGTETLTKVEQQAAGLSQKDMKLLLKVGGSENLDKITEELSGVNNRSIEALVKVKGTAELDRVLEEFRNLSPEQIEAVIKTIGAQDLEAAVTKMQQLVSVSEQISKPLAGAASRMAGLAAEVQSRFLPALNAAQIASESLTTQIKAGATVGEQQFARYEKRVRATVEAVERLAEASALAGVVPTGAELAFVRPGVRDDLAAAGVAGSRASELPEAAIGRGGLRGDVQLLSQAARYVVQLEASLSNAELLKIDTTQAQKNLDNARETLRRITEIVEGKISLNVRADEARQELARFKAEVRSLADSLGPPAGMEKLKTAAESANQAVQRLNAGLEKTKLAADIESLRTSIIAAGNMPAGAMREAALTTTAARATEIEQRANEANLPMVPRGDLVDSARALQGARIDRLRAIDTAWDQSVRGLVGGIDEVDQRFMSVADRISKLDLADRVDLDPAIAEFRMAAAAGETYSRQLELVAALEARVGRSEAIGTVGRQVESLPAGGVRDDLQARVAALRSAAASPFDLADPTDSTESVARSTAAAQSLGLPLEAPQRQIDGMISRTTALKSQLDQLPASVRSQFIPAIQAAELELVRMAGNADTTGDEIAQAAANLRNLEATARRLSSIDAFGRNFGNMNQFLGNARVREFSGEMEALGGVIAGARPGRARDRAAVAADRLARVRSDQLQLDEDERTSGLTFPDQRADLERRSRRAELVADGRAGEAAGISSRRARDRRMRGGDIGRGASGNAGMALAQLGYGIDDFMSTSGGLEQKLRGVSNNLTQMAFILGGTTGLFVGLGVVMAAQVGIQFMKYINNGRSAEDQTKALNDALARQKTLVEELAQAFQSLGESLAQGTLSAAGERGAEFERQMDGIQKKQAESRRERVGILDPAVQRERFEQNRIDREMQNSGDPAQRAALARELVESRAREQIAVDAAVARAAVTPDPESVASTLRGTVRETEFLEDGRLVARSREQAELRRSQIDGGVAGAKGDPMRLASVVRDRLEERSAVARQSIGVSNFDQAAEIMRARADVASLETLLASLEEPVRDAFERAAAEVVRSARGPAEQIREAQEEVAKAIELGLPGARIFGIQLDQTSELLTAANKKLKDAVAGRDEQGNKLSDEERQNRVEEARGEVADLESRRGRIEQQADALRYERTVDPQRQIGERMNRASGNLNAAGLEDGRIARRMREIENDRETIRQQSAKPEFQNPMAQRLLEESEAALNAEVAAIEAATIAIKVFAAALDRASEEAKGNLNSAQQAADEARRADLGNSTPQTQEARARAEADLERQREVEREAQTEIAVERDRLEQMQRPDAERAKEIDEELKSGREFDPGLANQREQVEADAAEAGESRQKFQNVVDAQKAFGDAVEARAEAEQALGITGTRDEKDKQLNDAGRGDLAENQSAAFRQMAQAERAVGLEWVAYSDGMDIARTELAAAIERQAQAATALAEIDEKIAAAGMSGSREELIRERADIQAKMEEDARESKAKVDAARDASTREAEQAKAAARGSELIKTPEQRFQEETDAGMESIRQYFGRKAEDEGGLVDFAGQRAAEEEFLKDREKEARTATAEGRGRELGMTERERFQRDMKEGTVADLTAEAKRLQGQGQDPAAFLRQGIANQMESVAPMMKQIQMEREDMLLQGPSRAALNVSDVSTTQGASELTRLLRGDDSAKDLNLAELKKQSQQMEDLIKAVQDANPTVLL